MTESSKNQQKQERRMQQQKWQKFADVLRHSVDADQNGGGNERGVCEGTQHQPTFDSASELKSPVLSDGQQSDLGTDTAVDESSNGMAEDGFELVVNKRNRYQRQKQINGGTRASDAATHIKGLHYSSTAAPHSANHQPAKGPIMSGNSNTPVSPKTPQTKASTAKISPYSLTRCMEERVAENEPDASNSSDSAFAENQSPSHGSSASLHFTGASDSVALSDDEKWPELSTVTKNDRRTKSNGSPTLPKANGRKSATPVEVKSRAMEKYSSSSRRSFKSQWKMVTIDVYYGKPNERKVNSYRRNFRPHAASEGEAGNRQNGTYNRRRPQNRRWNVSSSDAENLNTGMKNLEIRNKADSNESGNNCSQSGFHQQAQSSGGNKQQNCNQEKQNDMNGRNYRNNNNYHYDQQLADFNRRQMRAVRPARHSVPNIFQWQPNVPFYFMNQDYAPENMVQPLVNAPSVPPYLFPSVANIMFSNTIANDMHYAQFFNDLNQQNFLQYRPPFVPPSLMPQTAAPFMGATVAAPMPDTVVASEPSLPEYQPALSEQNFEEELSHLLRRAFPNDNERSLRDLTENPGIVSQMSFNERRIVLLNQMSYYFSAENLLKDMFLRQHMDEEGFVPLGLFLTFPRIKNLTLDANMIIGILANNNHFEMRITEKEVKIRSKSTLLNLSNNFKKTNSGGSPKAVSSPQPGCSNGNPARKLSQAATHNFSVDEIRARLMSRSKAPDSSIPDDSSQANSNYLPPAPQSMNDQCDDKWVIYKKKNRSSNVSGSADKEESVASIT